MYPVPDVHPSVEQKHLKTCSAFPTPHRRTDQTKHRTGDCGYTSAPLLVFMGLLQGERAFVNVWFQTLNKYHFQHKTLLEIWLWLGSKVSSVLTVLWLRYSSLCLVAGINLDSDLAVTVAPLRVNPDQEDSVSNSNICLACKGLCLPQSHWQGSLSAPAPSGWVFVCPSPIGEGLCLPQSLRQGFSLPQSHWQGTLSAPVPLARVFVCPSPIGEGLCLPRPRRDGSLSAPVPLARVFVCRSLFGKGLVCPSPIGKGICLPQSHWQGS